jgi:hypothetical protein
VCPRARRSLLEGIFEWAALVGRQGHRGVGHALLCLSEARLACLRVLSGDSSVCLRGPLGLSPTPLKMTTLISVLSYPLKKSC